MPEFCLPIRCLSFVANAAISAALWISCAAEAGTANSGQLPLCKGKFPEAWDGCVGTFSEKSQYIYRGEFRRGQKSGFGVLITIAARHRGNKYTGHFANDFKDGSGTYQYANGDSFVGQFKNDLRNGFGVFTYKNGDRYEGEFKNDMREGHGTFVRVTGERYSGIWSSDTLVKISEKGVDNPQANLNTRNRKPIETGRVNVERSDQTKTESSVIGDRKVRQDDLPPFAISAKASEPNPDGVVTIDINTGVDTSSLKINGKEEGGNRTGKYTVERVARVGQITDFQIVAVDVFGRSTDLLVSVHRKLELDSVSLELKPEEIPTRLKDDSVAVIIGLNKYRSIPYSDYSGNDAKLFFEYARKALGVRTDRIKLLLDEEASEANIIKTLKHWLPRNTKKNLSTIYLFYSGHGYFSQATSEYLILPYDADLDLIERTALTHTEIFKLLDDTGAEKIIVFMDSCFSGFSKTGKNLIQNARPLALATSKTLATKNVNIVSASQSSEISFSSDRLKHGIFSYFLMKGLEGNADLDGNRSITLGELHAYLEREVARFASSMNKTQTPQLQGNPSLTLMELR